MSPLNTIYNRPLEDNDFILAQSDKGTEWVSYHLIPNRVKVSVNLGFANTENEHDFIFNGFVIDLDYSVGEKSERKFVSPTISIHLGKYTQKILKIELNIDKILSNDKIQEVFNSSIENVALHIEQNLSQPDKALSLSYQGIITILRRVAEDFSQAELPEIETTV